ncbi:phosphatase PAP2 family protein [Empedobacter tilapiae]|uniref:Phosphatase PAP2 family protein n=1 Tax=Empedobacter tilapiae TaxID=2491114 RepID=A0A4Z1B6L2_9FLAO|nr:phosphatase PAP2 family protein [Empedobacter tilapiae]TGN29530.1 phosphatase PAP2 family protein [Empedobacter tilapiae]
MIDKLKNFDTQLFFCINEKHNAFFDVVMYWASHKWFWLPLYLTLAIFLVKLYGKASIYILLAIGMVITLSDQISSSVIKQWVQRPRPSHEPDLLPYIHLSKAGPGGMYGFVSSHAANVAALTIFLILLLPPRYKLLKVAIVSWALLVCYSRIYNGVHYPLDIIGGILVGIFSGFTVAIFAKRTFIKKEY